MPTTRKRKPRGRTEITSLMRVHLETGDCLINGPGKGCHCGLRDFDGRERTDVIQQLKAKLESEHGNP